MKKVILWGPETQAPWSLETSSPLYGLHAPSCCDWAISSRGMLVGGAGSNAWLLLLWEHCKDGAGLSPTGEEAWLWLLQTCWWGQLAIKMAGCKA